MLRECYCIVIRMEAVPEDDKKIKKDTPIKYYNELSVQRHYYREEDENVRVSANRQVWLSDFDMCIPMIRGGRCFIEYVFTHDLDRVNDYADMLIDHVRRAKKERPRWLLNLDYPFVKITDIQGLEGYRYVPDLKIWT